MATDSYFSLDVDLEGEFCIINTLLVLGAGDFYERYFDVLVGPSITIL